MLVVIFDDISRNSTAFSVTRPAKEPSPPVSAAIWLTDIGMIGSLEDELSVRLCFPLLVAELEFSAAVTGKVSAVSPCVKTCTKSSKPPSKLLLMSFISQTDKIADTSHEESPLISMRLAWECEGKDSLIGDNVTASVTGEEVATLGELDCFCLLYSRRHCFCSDGWITEVVWNLQESNLLDAWLFSRKYKQPEICLWKNWINKNTKK